MNTNDLEAAKQLLIKNMPYLPKAQIMRELSIVLERLRFVPDNNELLQHTDSKHVQSSLAFLFQQDISSDMLHTLQEIHEQGLGAILTEDEADGFYQYCQEYFDRLGEIRIISAVKLSPGFEQQLAVQLNRDSPDTTRVVFEVLPSITAGCMVVDPTGRTTDYSFKTNITFYAHRYLSRKLQELRS